MTDETDPTPAEAATDATPPVDIRIHTRGVPPAEQAAAVAVLLAAAADAAAPPTESHHRSRWTSNLRQSFTVGPGRWTRSNW